MKKLPFKYKFLYTKFVDYAGKDYCRRRICWCLKT